MQKYADFSQEDTPKFNQCKVLPYFHNEETGEIYFYLLKELGDPEGKPKCFGDYIEEREPSIIYTIARCLVTQSNCYFPCEEVESMQETRGPVEFYKNPLIEKIMIQLQFNEHSVFSIDQACMTVCYPLGKRMENLPALNQTFLISQYQIVEVPQNAFYPKALVRLHQEAIAIMSSTIPQIKSRLSKNEPARKPQYALLICDDTPNWSYTFQALFMGQLMETGKEKWQFYFCLNNELPSEDDLETIQTIIFPGSGYQAYNTQAGWIPPLKDFIKRITSKHPHIKMFGGCFGQQIIAEALGGKAEKMPFNQDRPKCIGREHIQLTDAFFQQIFVVSYMEKNGLTRETFPKLILQEAHGDHVTKLPVGATLLGYSQSCNVEIYCIGERALCFQSHPEFNSAYQQEFCELEYFKYGCIEEEYHKIANAKCADTSLGRETRNTALGLIREFIKQT